MNEPGSNKGKWFLAVSFVFAFPVMYIVIRSECWFQAGWF